jgi:glutamine synthetase adenylyltransferase
MNHLRLIRSQESEDPVETLMQRVLDSVREQFGELLDGPQGEELRSRIWDAVLSDLVVEEKGSQQNK